MFDKCNSEMRRKPKGKDKTGRNTDAKPNGKVEDEKLVSGDNKLIAEVAGTTRQYVGMVKAGERYNAKIAYLLKILPKEKLYMKNRLIDAVEKLFGK